MSETALPCHSPGRRRLWDWRVVGPRPLIRFLLIEDNTGGLASLTMSGQQASLYQHHRPATDVTSTTVVASQLEQELPDENTEHQVEQPLLSMADERVFELRHSLIRLDAYGVPARLPLVVAERLFFELVRRVHQTR
jgi:hypothetical protein